MDYEIKDESTEAGPRYQLYVDGQPRGAVVDKGQGFKLVWQTAGPFSIEESRAWVEGLRALIKLCNDASRTAPQRRRDRKRFGRAAWAAKLLTDLTRWATIETRAGMSTVTEFEGKTPIASTEVDVTDLLHALVKRIRK